MSNAIRDAGIPPSEVDYINAHATSTSLGDLAETIAIKRTLGEHAKKVAVSSTKSMTGHLLGAAGVVEAIFSILAIRDGILPPTINLENPDEGCDLDYVPRTARKARVRVACRTPSVSAARTAASCSVLRTEPAAPGSSPVEFRDLKRARTRGLGAARRCTARAS